MALIWLMTDERADPVAALRRLPPGAGVVFRHHATPPAERRRLWTRLRRIAWARGVVMVRAGAVRLPGEDGVHGRGKAMTWPAHDRRQAREGARAGAMLFVSPVFATRSHPGATALGPARAARIGRGLGVPLIALGGVDARRFARLRRLGFAGWAAIDAFGG
jgi:thiamine-phosphate pyrophosphorylase